MVRYAAVSLALLSLVGCVELPEGRIACGAPPDRCPDGWFCHTSDNLCRRTPPDAAVRDASTDSGLDAGIDGGARDAGPVDAGPPELSLVGTFVSSGNAQIEGVSAAGTTGSAYVVGWFEDELTLPDGSTLDATAGNRDGFLVRIDTSGEVLWEHTLRGRFADTLNEVDGDGTGVLVAGTFQETASIADAGLTEPDGGTSRDGVVFSFEADGTYEWATELRSAGVVEVSALRRSHDRVRVGGLYEGSLRSTSLPAADTAGDAYVVALHLSDGRLDSDRTLGLSSPGRDLVLAIERTQSGVDGPYWVGGLHGGTSDAGVTGVLGEPTRSRDGFVHSRQRETELNWGTTVGGTSGTDAVVGLARITDNDVVLAMTAGADIVTGDFTGSGPPGSAIGIVQRRHGVGDGDGDDGVDWTVSLEAEGGDVFLADVVSARGAVWVAGSFRGSVDFAGGAVSSTDPGETDTFILELDAGDGSLRFSFILAGGGPEVITDLDIDASGNVWVAGHFRGTLELPGSDPVSATGVDGFLARIRVP